jgi:hypothetical protein
LLSNIKLEEFKFIHQNKFTNNKLR